jgi:tetrapyrrole methylase family protein/MazG family protein
MENELAEVRSFICAAAPPQLVEFLAEKGRRLINLETLAGEEEDLSCAARGEKMLAALLAAAAAQRQTALILPGRPWLGDLLPGQLRQRLSPQEITLRYLPGEEIMFGLLDHIHLTSRGEEGKSAEEESFLCNRGVTFLDACCGEELKDPPRGELLISQVYSRSLLLKLAECLTRIYPPRHPAALWQFDRRGEAHCCGVWPLNELTADCALPPLHSWSFLHLAPPPRCTLGDMTAMMAGLRAPGGCPWDRQQDHRSLRPYLLEETYEVLEAIDSGVAADLCEELGDLLLQVVFHSELAREKGEFSFWEVVDGITRKIYRRHPHVFQQEKAADARAVSRRWQEIKLQEKEQGGKSTRRFDLPPGLPALMQAQKIQKRAAAVGFDWPHAGGALAKVGEELRELEAERTAGNREKIEEEFGDLLFAMVNVARFLGVDAEQSLAAAIRKFTRRFAHIEEKVEASGKDFKAFSLAELDHFWEEAKSRNK